MDSGVVRRPWSELGPWVSARLDFWRECVEHEWQGAGLRLRPGIAAGRPVAVGDDFWREPGNADLGVDATSHMTRSPG